MIMINRMVIIDRKVRSRSRLGRCWSQSTWRRGWAGGHTAAPMPAALGATQLSPCLGWGLHSCAHACLARLASPACIRSRSPLLKACRCSSAPAAAGRQPVPQPAGQARDVVPPRQEGAAAQRSTAQHRAVGDGLQSWAQHHAQKRCTPTSCFCVLITPWVQIALDVARGLVYLHSRRIVHRETAWLGTAPTATPLC